MKLDGTPLSAAEVQAALGAFGDGKSRAHISADKYRRSDRKVKARVKEDLIDFYTEEMLTAAVLTEIH